MLSEGVLLLLTPQTEGSCFSASTEAGNLPTKHIHLDRAKSSIFGPSFATIIFAGGGIASFYCSIYGIP
jgi:hypothetical protein